MAYIRSRRRKDGTVAHGVFWVERETGRETSLTFDDKSEAELLRRFLNDNDQTFRLAQESVLAMRSKAPTVTRMVTEHIDHLTGIESGTIARYRALQRNHIDPALGDFPVDTLSRRQVLEWFNGLDMSDKSRKNIHALLSSSLARAVAQGHMDENPAKGVKAPSTGVRTREPVFLTRSEFNTLVNGFDERFRVLLRFLAGTGMRFGEATAVRKRDVRVENDRATVAIIRAWKRTDNGIKVGGPKTRTSRRWIKLSPGLTKRLADHMDGLRADDLVFTAPQGGRLPHNRFMDTYWNPAVEELVDSGQLAVSPTPHDLRHTHASWLIAEGVPLPVISARLGHKSIKTTVDTYGHLVADADQTAADMIDP